MFLLQAGPADAGKAIELENNLMMEVALWFTAECKLQALASK